MTFKLGLCTIVSMISVGALAQEESCSMALGNYRYDRLLILNAALQPFVNRIGILNQILDEVRALESLGSESAIRSDFGVSLTLLSPGQISLSISYEFAGHSHDQSTQHLEWCISTDDKRVGHLRRIN